MHTPMPGNDKSLCRRISNSIVILTYSHEGIPRLMDLARNKRTDEEVIVVLDPLDMSILTSDFTHKEKPVKRN